MVKKQVETEDEKREREVIEDIATNIAGLSKAVQTLLGGRLKRKSLVILLAHSSGLPQYQVEKVLGALENLEKDHLNR